MYTARILKNFASGIIALVLLAIGYYYFISDEQKDLILNISFSTHLISIILVIPVYVCSGLELFLLYKHLGKVKLSGYDIVSLPIVVALWGFLIPFQGSFIYTVSYIFSKYKNSLAENIKVYLLSFSISMAIAGFAGTAYYLASESILSYLFLVISLLLLINPVVLYGLGRLSDRLNFTELGWVTTLAKRSSLILNRDKIDNHLVVYLVLIKSLNMALTTLWSYWIVYSLGINLNVIQLILISLLMRMTLLLKLTPGNIGLSQFASGGIAVLVGGTMADGFLLSSFQYLSIIIVAFTFGTLFTIVNLKYFKWQDVKTIFTHQGN